MNVQRLTSKFSHVIALLCALVVLTGCDGESRPFQEAVEVRTLDIVAIDVSAPAGSLDDIFLNIGQGLQLYVEALNSDDNVVVLTSNDRRWKVSDSSVASVSEDGYLSALANGEVSVSLQIADLESAAFTLTVSNAELVEVNEILGPAELERCLPKVYRATGLYRDNSTRSLPDVAWQLADSGTGNTLINGDLSVDADSIATVTGYNVDSLQLTASVGDFSLNTPVPVSGSLFEISIITSVADNEIEVGETASLTAYGLYSGEEPAVPGNESTDSSDSDSGGSDTDTTDTTDTSTAAGRKHAITKWATWRITSGSSNVNISNSGNTSGQLTGEDEGDATISVSCGDFQPSTYSIAVVESSEDAGISIDTDELLNLTSRSASVQLRVSTGTVFDEDNEINASEIEWTYTSENGNQTPPFFLSDEGLLDFLADGNGTVTATVTNTGESVTIDIKVGTN